MQVEQVATTGYKWLRAVAEGEFTGLHCDKVFLGRGSQRLLTAWLPLSQVGQHCGSAHRSHPRPGLARCSRPGRVVLHLGAEGGSVTLAVDTLAMPPILQLSYALA